MSDKGLELGMAAPSWQLDDLDGRIVTLEQFRGRPLLMFFFRGTWCPNCRKQMEDIAQQWSRLESVSAVVGIAGQDAAGIRSYLEHNPLPYPLLPDNDRQVIKNYGIYQAFGFNGFRVAYPTTILVDRKGIVRYCYVGSQFDRPNLDNVIDEVQKLSGAVTA